MYDILHSNTVKGLLFFNRNCSSCDFQGRPGCRVLEHKVPLDDQLPVALSLLGKFSDSHFFPLVMVKAGWRWQLLVRKKTALHRVKIPPHPRAPLETTAAAQELYLFHASSKAYPGLSYRSTTSLATSASPTTAETIFCTRQETVLELRKK